MRKLTPEEWDDRYVGGPVKLFDQKNIMYIRPLWDLELNKRIKSWSFVGKATGRPGHMPEDLALRWGARRGTMLMANYNWFRPNPSPTSLAIKELFEKRDPELKMLTGGYSAPKDKPLDVSDPARISNIVKKAALWFGADDVGICKVDKRWNYSHTYNPKGSRGVVTPGKVAEGGCDSIPQEIPEEYKYVIVLAYEEDYEMIKYYPSHIAHAATSMGYSRMAITNNYLSAFIRYLGYQTIDDTANAVGTTIPYAMQSGLGDIGRNGLLIHPKWGPRVRVSKVMTDLPLLTDDPVDFGALDYCGKCTICADSCPVKAISKEERTIEPRSISNRSGIKKWPVDVEKCRMYWGQLNRPCTTCIATCPYNKPYNWMHRIVLWITDHARWTQRIIIKADQLFGYGKRRDPVNFWEEWKPKKNR